MANKLLKFELNKKGVRELLKSQEMVDVLMSYADRVAENAGDGFNSYIGRNRANVSVAASTPEAEKKNYKDNTLIKALGSAGG